MANAALPALATAGSLASRLGQALPTDPVIAQQWDDAMLDASSAVRDTIGQPLTRDSSTLEVTINEYGRGLIPISPVVEVTEVLDPQGVALPTDGSGFQVVGQRITIYRAYRIRNPFDIVADPVYTLTVEHGWDPMPGELLRWTYVLAAAQIANAAFGSLGINGGASEIGIDDGRVKFADLQGMIPDRVQARLKAMYGGEQQ